MTNEMKDRLLNDAIDVPVILGKDGKIDWSVTKAFWHERWRAIQKALSEG